MNHWNKKKLKAFIKGVPINELTTHASSITFFFFIAMIPLFILAFALFPYTGITEAQVTELIDLYTPAAAESMIARIVHQAYSASAGVYWVSVLFMIWSSSRSINALRKALNAIYHTEGKRRWIIRILLNILDTLIIVALLVYLLFLHGMKADLIENMAEMDIPFVEWLARTTNYVTAFLTAVLILGLLYTFVPDGRRNYVRQLPGAACAALGWIIFSLLFRIYINGTNIYQSFYGSLATVAIFLFWLYCCFMILLVGAFINQVIVRKSSR